MMAEQSGSVFISNHFIRSTNVLLFAAAAGAAVGGKKEEERVTRRSESSVSLSLADSSTRQKIMPIDFASMYAIV